VGLAVLDRIKYSASYTLAAEQLRRAIELGTYLPGDRFPPERELATQLGVSRATLREAVRSLLAAGLVEMKRGPQGGLVVLERDFDEKELRRTLHARKAEVAAVLDFREAVEGHAARLAAQRRTKAHVRQLEAELDAMEQAIREPPGAPSSGRFQRADGRFHIGIAEASGNQWLREAVEDARVHMFAPIGAALWNVVSNANNHHAEILEAIRDKRPEDAARAMAAHIDTTRRDVEKYTSPLGLRGRRVRR
jgi:GntR family transcriptional regulator, transcriptional repressor for pyruvate dehydrogenase complex